MGKKGLKRNMKRYWQVEQLMERSNKAVLRYYEDQEYVARVGSTINLWDGKGDRGTVTLTKLTGNDDKVNVRMTTPNAKEIMLRFAGKTAGNDYEAWLDKFKRASKIYGTFDVKSSG